MKNPVCIVLFLCNALLACNRENPKTPLPVARQSKVISAATYLQRFERDHDPVDLLRALETARGYHRAFALERLGLTREAILAWDEVSREDSEHSTEAREHRLRLQQRPDPVRQWSPDDLANALKRRNAAALRKITQAFPAEVARSFEKSDLRDREGARLLATVLAETGELYPKAVVDAMQRPKDAAAFEQGLVALYQADFSRAAMLFELAGNPFHLTARYFAAATSRSRSILDAAIPYLKPDYRELSSRMHMTRAYLLEIDGRYLEAHAAYALALAAAKNEPTSTAGNLARRSANYSVIGDAGAAFHDAYDAINLLDRVADTNTRHQTYGAAAMAARELGYPLVELDYRNAAVETTQRALLAASARALTDAKLQLAVALRARAETHLEFGRDADAAGDLQQAADLAEAVDDASIRELLRMRVREVRGQALLKSRPADAQTAFTEAIGLARKRDSTYRATLYFQRATAYRNAGDRRADNDLATALELLRNEVRQALAKKPEAASEPLWTPYFSRFREKHDELIESLIVAGDAEGAFVHAELARAFEPMQILLQSRAAPPGFRPIETIADFRQARASLPEDTVILQYLVLPKGTYTWVVTREQFRLVSSSVTREKIQGWVTDAFEAVTAKQQPPLLRVTRAAYSELFSAALNEAGASKTRIVIVPDESMQGFPFNALGTSKDYLIERASIATTGSLSLYLYALARDRQLAAERTPSVLLIGNPAFDAMPRLPAAEAEVEELARDHYHGATELTDTEATVRRFLAEARKATIIHFAGHALASAQNPWQSRLLLAPHEQESGELSAQRLMQELPRLARTRLVVLGACSTAGGAPVGPQGLAPLVRPLIAADVPAVVGSLWDVKDASTKKLLVSFHCHYRHGDDVAVALRNAQLERLRDIEPEPVRAWAAFQVVGYAASPYPRSIALEKSNSEHLCTQNSLLRPDGLHPQ